MFPVLIVVAGVGALLLGLDAFRTVLDSTIGREDQSAEPGPDDPGYIGFVTPTRTLLVLHTNESALVGVTFLAASNGGTGGAAVLLASDLLVDPTAERQQGQPLRDVYASGGASAVRHSAERLFGIGFEEVIEMSRFDLAAAMTPAGTLSYELLDDLLATNADGTTRVVYGSGRLNLSPGAAAHIYGFHNPAEADANRVERQRLIWESWLDTIGRADDPGSAVLPFGEGLSPFLVALGAGSPTVEVAPLQAVTLPEASLPFYVLGEEGRSWLLSRTREIVSWPTAPESFLRPRVQVLDGIQDAARRNELAQDIISVGGIVTVMGNAAEFGQQETLVAYHRAEAMSTAEAIAVVLQSGGQAAGMAFVETSDGTEDLADITVTVGLDLATR